MAQRNHGDPRNIEPAAFPHQGGPRDRLRFALRYAVLAPSSHNSQPWRFRLHDDHVDILADNTRALSAVDPQRRELAMSCGATAEHLLIALAAFGIGTECRLLPEPERPDLVARVTVTGSVDPTTHDRDLVAAILTRHCDRTPYAPTELPDFVLDDLTEATRTLGIDLRLVLDDEGKSAIAGLVAEATRRQHADPAFRAELSDWMRRAAAPGKDGLSMAGFGAPDLATPLLAAAIRRFDIGSLLAKGDRARMDATPVLAVMLSPGDTLTDWLKTGRALARLFLTATVAGVSLALVNQPVEIPDLRAHLASLVTDGSDHPQLLLRLGYPAGANAKPNRPSARRSLDDVLAES
ncbi:MAG: hypothetical protein C0606_11995 [Hyphomicrobiales bacterium]|nr:MAG: hypothetical protein C0606_11995 [Hyphomicrobiales bacterium]